MGDTPPYLKALEEIERHGIPGLMEGVREEGIDGVRYALWDATGWHRDGPAGQQDKHHGGVSKTASLRRKV